MHEAGKGWIELVADYVGAVRASGYRCLLVVHAADIDGAVGEVAGVLRGSCILVAPSRIRAPRGCKAAGPGGFERLLGGEADYVVLASDGLLRPNVIAGMAGVVRGGGLLVLVVPPLERWDPGLGRGVFRRYLLSSLSEARCILWLDADGNRVILYRQPPREPPGRRGGCTEQRGSEWLGGAGAAGRLARLAVTCDQARALLEFSRFLGGRERSFLVIGDRGRGKSYLLGLAVALAARRGVAGDVPVVAPSAASLASFFRGLLAGLRALGVRHRVRKGGGDVVAVVGPWGRVYHVEPDEAKPSGFIVFDEAAAAGLARVRRLSWKSGRVLLATTIHGYEGSGRVFQHMLLDVLPKPVIQVELREPIRYPENDPLEEWVNTVFTLKPGEVETPPEPVALEECSYESVSPEELAGQAGLLRELLQLLALAHYRTEPDYLLTILESDNHTVHMLRCKGRLVAAADLAFEEWRVDVEEAARLTLKTLWLQTGREPAGVRAARVVRIAVHPKLQRRGLGSMLLRKLEDYARGRGADMVSALFGRHDVIGFWERNSYTLFYVSPRYNRATGEKNLGFAKPLTERGKGILWEASRRARLKLIFSAHAVYRDLAAEKLAKLLTLTRPATLPPPAIDGEAVRRYLEGLVDHEQVFDQLYLLVTHTLAGGGEKLLGERERVLLAARFLQGKPLGEAAEYAGVNVEEAQKLMRNAIKTLYSQLRGMGR